MGDDSDDRVEISDSSASGSNGELATEATKDLPAQLEKEREAQAQKKRGRSGISDTFGKPVIEDDMKSPLDPPVRGSDIGSYKVRSPGQPGAPPVADTGRLKIDEPMVVIVAYPGETINRDVEPSVVTAKKGQTLSEIAKDHLGAGASEDEIKKHVKEIANLNGIKNANLPLEERKLSLPGHTKSGAFITMDADGNKRTRRPNGDLEVQNCNGTRFVRTYGSDGAYEEQHFGPRPEDNYYVGRTADGRYQVADTSPDGEIITSPKYDAPVHDARGERAKLNDLAEATITDQKELARFRADMVKFDARSKELTELYQKQGLSETDAQKKAQEEIAKTYEHVQKLLEDNPSATLDQKSRVRIAEQVMHQAADPTEVDQGNQGTCNVATVESRAYTVNPSEAARLVADVATTGKYKSNAGTEVEFDKKDLQPFGESKKNPPEEGCRSYASQLFQVTAINVHYTRAHKSGGSDIRYRQQEPKPGAKPEPDNGERLSDYKNPKAPAEVLGDNGRGKRTPGLSDAQIVAVSQEIVTGDKKLSDGTPGPVLLQTDSDGGASARNYLDLQQQNVDRQAKYAGELVGIWTNGERKPLDPKDPESLRKAREALDNAPDLEPANRERTKKEIDELEKEISKLEKMKLYGDTNDGTVHVRDEKHFEDVIAKAKAEGRLPLIVHVFSYHDPFSAQSGGSAGDQGDAHVITVTDYHPAEPGTPGKLARVSVDNQWGTPKDFNDDKGMPIADLYKSTKPSESISALEALKAKRETKGISNADYDKEVAKIMLEAERRWKKEDADGTLSQSEHDRFVKFWKSELSTLSPPSRAKDIQSRVADDCKKEGLTDNLSKSITPLEELKTKREKKKISDADYEKEVAELMLKAERRWDKERRDGTYSKAEHDRMTEAWLDELKTLKPPSRSQEIISKVAADCKAEGLNEKMKDSISPLEELKAKREAKTITDEDYDKQIEQLMFDAERRWNKEEQAGTYSKEEHDRLVHYWFSELRQLKPPSRVSAIVKKLGEDCDKEGLTDPSRRHS